MNNVLLWTVATPFIMWALYLVGIQAKRGGLWLALLPITLVAYIADVILNYTLFALFTWDRPRVGEITFSNRLSRLVNRFDWRGTCARWIARYMLDWADPSGIHIIPNLRFA